MKHNFEFAGLRYPRSFLKLLLLGFVLVSLPLVIALLNATAYVERLTSRSQTAVDQAAEAARDSRALLEQVTAMERLARQYLILGDASLLTDYARVRASFRRITSDMSLLPLDEPQLQQLNRTIDKEQELFEQLARARGVGRGQLIAGYVELSQLANDVLEQSNGLIDREIDNMRAAGQRARRSMLWQLAGAIPLGVLVAILFAFLIARPIRQLEHAIRQLGSAEFSTGIRVRGPADLQYLGERLEWLRQRLVELEGQKTQFLRQVSHELKTPLTALREGAELLADGSSGALNRQQAEIADILRQNSLQLQRQIEGLLGYQQALDSVRQIEFKPVDPGAIVRNVVDAHKLAIAARNLKLDLQLEPAPLEADADKLRVILDNLLSNAVKYSPEGGTIYVSVRRAADTIQIEVGDVGPGIRAEDRGRVFDWFFQGKPGHRGRIKGSGLGLAIAREFVQAHQGKIELIAERTPGAHFRVSLPATHTRT